MATPPTLQLSLKQLSLPFTHILRIQDLRTHYPDLPIVLQTYLIHNPTQQLSIYYSDSLYRYAIIPLSLQNLYLKYEEDYSTLQSIVNTFKAQWPSSDPLPTQFAIYLAS